VKRIEKGGERFKNRVRNRKNKKRIEKGGEIKKVKKIVVKNRQKGTVKRTYINLKG
jgi:hypothetical protein